MKANFPLASLALFVTVAACLLACVDGERLQRRIQSLATNGFWPTVSVFAGAALFGAMIGLIYLAFGRGKWRARLLAPVAGLLAGEIGLLILIAPGPIWRTTFAVGVLMLAAVLFRLGAE